MTRQGLKVQSCHTDKRRTGPDKSIQPLADVDALRGNCRESRWRIIPFLLQGKVSRAGNANARAALPDGFGQSAKRIYQALHPAARDAIKLWHILFDHHLTTFLSGVSRHINFHVSTFFYGDNNQRGNLRTSHKFLRCSILYCRMSQFSDPKGRRFESCQPHQKMSLYCRTSTFLFCLL